MKLSGAGYLYEEQQESHGCPLVGGAQDVTGAGVNV